MKNKINSLYLVAQYLINNEKCYIHNMKKVTKANNVGERIRQLRSKQWEVETILEGYKDGVAVYFYKLVNIGAMPKQYR